MVTRENAGPGGGAAHLFLSICFLGVLRGCSPGFKVGLVPTPSSALAPLSAENRNFPPDSA